MKLACLAKGVLGSILTVILVSTVTADAGQKQSGESQAVREIRALLDRQVECWNRRDLEGFMDGYWRSTELTFYSGGTALSSWDKTIDRYRQRYQSAGNEMGHLDFSELKIEMLGDRAAFVRGRWRLKMTASEPGGLFTLTLRKLAGGWKIVHDHTSSN
ncbi:MAG TPA: nuclear transport factor 2 family protein [Blastocatellia bacterium]|nr:nuclear transport factor 2 family protein [Blastocatellia bacterium]